jgi:serine/threonine protein kinase
MQILSQEPTRWQKVDNDVYSRRKNGRDILYRTGELLGSGKRACVYELIPDGGGRPKALKISGCAYSVNDTEISRSVHSQGLVAGIVKPSKAFFVDGHVWITILPKYEGSLDQLLIAKKISENEVVQGLQEVSCGLKKLHELQIAHCDLCLSNILVGTWKGKRRFDLADFERCLDFSGFTIAKEFFEAFQKRQLNVLYESAINYGSDNYLNFCRVIILKTDVWLFGKLMVNLKKHTQGILIEMVSKLGENIIQTKTLTGVQETLTLIETEGLKGFK